jgi:hypothetical protein
VIGHDLPSALDVGALGLTCARAVFGNSIDSI